MNTIVIGYPLRGVWRVPVSPADHIPSHYTHKFGLGYAFDFIKESNKTNAFGALFKSRAASDDEGWGQSVYSPVTGIVREVCQNTPDRKTINVFSNFKSSINALCFNPNKSEFNTLFGNYLVIEFNGIFCLLAHLQYQSIAVNIGDKVSQGALLGCLGHNGSSHGPHLHLQLMDNLDLTQAKGLPCAFAEYEEQQSSNWIKVASKTPSKNELTRFQ